MSEKSIERNDVAKIMKIPLQARQKTYHLLNAATTGGYWHIGKRIVEEERNGKEKAEYAESLLKNLSIALSAEFGKGFSFVARLFRISTETSHFNIDLVLLQKFTKCFVIFDSKTSKLTHQDVGQLDMYVRMFDELKKQTEDNPTGGIILCAEKDETVVKYSVLNDNKKLFASKYRVICLRKANLNNLLNKTV